MFRFTVARSTPPDIGLDPPAGPLAEGLFRHPSSSRAA
jgi:hypothetical protein